MIVSLYIVLFIIGVLLTIYAVENDSIIFCLINVVLWLVLMAESLNIQSLYYDTNGVAGFLQKSEWGISAFCLVFIFLNLIYALALQFDWRKKFP
ncbi:MAG: hypothetical protein DRN16_02390 [Thermoplasmata archaeon]|nr:MAG: hypothetical protein DRN16_02390 [Thermoplasmata archaeon]